MQQAFLKFKHINHIVCCDKYAFCCLTLRTYQIIPIKNVTASVLSMKHFVGQNTNFWLKIFKIYSRNNNFL